MKVDINLIVITKMTYTPYQYGQTHAKDSLLLIVLVICLVLLLSAVAIMYIPDMIRP